MTTPTIFEQTGVSVHAYDPDIDTSGPTYTPAFRLMDDQIGKRATSMTFTISAMGGWDKASITFPDTIMMVEDWFSNGLNRHIVFYAPSLERVFAGFVNELSITLGTLTAKRGPVMDVVNRVSVAYTPILDDIAVPSVKGVKTVTPIAEDATSQSQWGILEKTINGGELLDDGTTNEATQLRDTYLEEYKDPQTSESLNIMTGNPPQITLNLLGYVHRLKAYIIQDLTQSSIQISNASPVGKMQTVLGLDPNGLFSTDYTQLAQNLALAPEYEDEERTAWNVITDLVAQGDTSNNRYTFGVYDNQRAIYDAIPTTVDYFHRITGESMILRDYNAGFIVDPWYVLPARWVFMTDFLALTAPRTANFRLDPRYLFIESLKYTAPLGLNLTGGKTDTLAQMIATFGV